MPRALAQAGDSCGSGSCIQIRGADGQLENICDPPGADTCADPSAGLTCQPGAQVNVRSCYNAGASGNIGGYQECVYTCKSDGSGYDQVCRNSSFNGEGHPLIEWSYCDYSAGSGCAADGDGTLNGRWTEITEQCSPAGNANPQIDRGACGGPCRQCPAGAGCEATTCPVPKLAPSGSCSWMASWDGHGLASVNNPVPQVQRSPFPRGMVGVPNQLQIISSCAGPTASGGISRNKDEQPYRTCGGQEIYGYRVSMGWMCAGPTHGATWTMDERSWNIGQTNERGEVIQAKETGDRVTHTFETSSYGKPKNGPNAGNERQPAYQVQLETRWSLAANFQKLVKSEATGCWADADGTQPITPCPTEFECSQPGASCPTIPFRKITRLEWKPAQSMLAANQPVFGAAVPQDVAYPGGCNAPVPISVIQSQTILTKP